MKSREEHLTNSRPRFFGANSFHQSAEEKFQNTVLRPIVKFQQDLLLQIFKNYLRKHKSMFYELDADKKLLFIENTLQKDFKFRNILKGVVIGQFTVKEFVDYQENSSALNKRIIFLIKESLQYNVQLLRLDNAI